MEVKKENKFFVLKQEDLDEYFGQFTKGVFTTKEEQTFIDKIPWKDVIDGVQKRRMELCKPPYNDYVVCNQDEPYAELVWQIILTFEELRNKHGKQMCHVLREKEELKAKIPPLKL